MYERPFQGRNLVRRFRIIGIILWLAGVPGILLAQQPVPVPDPGESAVLLNLGERFESSKEDQMMRAYFRARVGLALDRRRESLERLETIQAIESYQSRLRSFFADTVDLGSFERTPLRPVIAGRLERDGYTIENVIFESQPGFHVTGNLYLPDGEGPFPGILHPCGHTDNGKAAVVYQKVNHLLVQNGFVVLCYDPIGQGERKQLLDPKTGKSLARPTSEHQVLGVAPVLLGRGLSSYMIWDGMRGIDYLQDRPEVDPDRIGCTGNSGGGNLTSFLMALDDRIEAAAPGCFMTTTRMKNERPGPGDPEQNLFAQVREGLDHPDFALMRAPKPTLILAATEDFVPIEGTWDAFRQAKRLYTRLGRAEAVDLVEAPEKHGYSRPLREAAVRFFQRWLKGENSIIVEPGDVPIESDGDLRCTPKGQVLAIEGARSVFDLNRERADALRKQRAGRWESLPEKEKREKVEELLGIDRDSIPAVEGQSLAGERSGSGSGFPETSEMVFEIEPGIAIPALRTHSPGNGETRADQAPVHLVCLEGSWDSFQVPVSPVIPKAWSDQGGELVIINPRDSGFTRTKNWRFPGADWWIGYLLGDSYLAMRTRDLLALAVTLQEEGGVPFRPIHLHAEGEFGPAALHAAALAPERFASVTVHGGLETWETVVDSREPHRHLNQVVHGALASYDLGDLEDLVGEGKLRRVTSPGDSTR